MSVSSVNSKFGFWLYRLKTVCRSLKYLYSLPQETIDSFLDSYVIYEHDWADEKKLVEEMGPEYAKEVSKKLVDYYSVLNHLCAIGQVEKMYIPPAMDLQKSIIANQTLFERRMCRDLDISEGKRVLDIGCGRGRVANHMAQFSKAQLVGINIDDNQLESARKFAEGNGLENQCRFLRWDLNEIPYPFPDHSFDAIYDIQVFSLSKDREKLFQEIKRLLKPGGTFGLLEWVLLDAYDEKNPHHLHLMKQVKPVIGAIGNPRIEDYASAMRSAGLKIVTNENASMNGLQSPLIDNADKFYTRLGKMIYSLVRWKVLPAHFATLFERLSRGGQAFIEADRLRLVTTSHYMVARKG